MFSQSFVGFSFNRENHPCHSWKGHTVIFSFNVFKLFVLPISYFLLDYFNSSENLLRIFWGAEGTLYSNNFVIASTSLFSIDDAGVFSEGLSTGNWKTEEPCAFTQLIHCKIQRLLWASLRFKSQTVQQKFSIVFPCLPQELHVIRHFASFEYILISFVPHVTNYSCTEREHCLSF